MNSNCKVQAISSTLKRSNLKLELYILPSLIIIIYYAALIKQRNFKTYFVLSNFVNFV